MSTKTVCLHPRLSRNSPLLWLLPWLQPRPGVQMDESHSPGRSRWGKQSLELVRRAIPSGSLGWERGCFVFSSQPQAGCSLLDTWDGHQFLGCLRRLPDSREGISWPWLQVQWACIVRTLRFEYVTRLAESLACEC